MKEIIIKVQVPEGRFIDFVIHNGKEAINHKSCNFSQIDLPTPEESQNEAGKGWRAGRSLFIQAFMECDKFWREKFKIQ